MRKSLKKRNEKIHNRHITCIVASAGNDCSRIKDHGQRLGPAWPADQDQWPEASSSKPHDSRISKQQARTAKRPAASFKLDKLQAVGYNRIMEQFKLNALVEERIDYVKELVIRDRYDELYEVISLNFGFDKLSKEEIDEQYEHLKNINVN